MFCGVGREVVHEGKVEVSKTLGFTEELIEGVVERACVAVD